MRGDIVPPRRPDGQPSRRTDTMPNTVAPVTSQRLLTPDDESSKTVSVSSTPIVTDVKVDDIKDDKPKKRWYTRRPFIILAGIGAVLVVLIIAVIVWYTQGLMAVDPSSDEKVKVTIEPGSGVADIAATLKKSGLIHNDVVFDWYIRVHGKAGALQSGGYRLSKSEDVPTIVGHLTSGNTDTFSITFLPGATLAKHRQVLIDAGYSAAAVDAALAKTYDHPLMAGKPADTDLEGYIYGETYNFPADATPEQILTRTFDQFQSVVEKEGLVASYQKQGFTLYQGITLASIIQREVSSAEDAAQVAQVFELRLKQGMILGSDVTYQYIADKTGQARSVDLDSPYNTRRYGGLPPGPIASPGIAALKAVGAPAAGDYLFFISGDDDKTYFARTNEEHEKNVTEHCQKKCQII